MRDYLKNATCIKLWQVALWKDRSSPWLMVVGAVVMRPGAGGRAPRKK